MIEKILERLEEEREIAYADFDKYANDYELDLEDTYDDFFYKGLARAKTIVQEESKNGGWIPVEVAMPEEHESIFAKFKGTDKWDEGMFEKISDDVSATIEFLNGTRKTKVLHTVDGKWTDGINSSYSVIAWQPLPAPYQKGE